MNFSTHAQKHTPCAKFSIRVSGWHVNNLVVASIPITLNTISNMWHEARKQEKKIREAMIDYQRRAERRREHYAKIVGKVDSNSK